MNIWYGVDVGGGGLVAPVVLHHSMVTRYSPTRQLLKVHEQQGSKAPAAGRWSLTYT